MLISEKITLLISAWMVFVLIFAMDTTLEMFLVLLLIGLLVVKIFTDRYTLTRFKHRMNIFILAFSLLFVIIISRKVINFAGI